MTPEDTFTRRLDGGVKLNREARVDGAGPGVKVSEVDEVSEVSVAASGRGAGVVGAGEDGDAELARVCADFLDGGFPIASRGLRAGAASLR